MFNFEASTLLLENKIYKLIRIKFILLPISPCIHPSICQSIHPSNPPFQSLSDCYGSKSSEDVLRAFP